MLIITINNTRKKLRIFLICAAILVLILAALALWGRSSSATVLAGSEGQSASEEYYPGDPIRVTTEAEQFLAGLLQEAGYGQE